MTRTWKETKWCSLTQHRQRKQGRRQSATSHGRKDGSCTFQFCHFQKNTTHKASLILPGFRHDGCLDGCHMQNGVSVIVEICDIKAKRRTNRRTEGLCMSSSTFAAPQNVPVNSVINKATHTWANSYSPFITLPLEAFVVASQFEDFLPPLLLLCLGDLVTTWTVTALGLPTLLQLTGNWALCCGQSIHTWRWVLDTKAPEAIHVLDLKLHPALNLIPQLFPSILIFDSLFYLLLSALYLLLGNWQPLEFP